MKGGAPAPVPLRSKGVIMIYDIIVVGGGPAGMTAALYALRNGKSALVIEKAGFGGQITNSPKVENFPGSLSLSGNELADSMFSQIMEQGADIEIETVTEIRDARLPESSKNPEIDSLISGKPRIILLNKADYADESATAKWIEYYQKQGIYALAVECRTGKG